ncbi:hypothetical protein Pisl_1177 [Pyrobaculum islandicum DSM 4184]|uniref:Uncharacterized protein n=1 Tax=Pyrobaculum islandicum (strain DSM 4184 / JCM 9189 / GEO3) TaxID=384616 RepID=A1RTR3_PYRIL|nr:hypothetical protein [Pyrobaculum islandicum]ABL88345.1 hypothetical protein Pisl_1177 [Pyrobaculum islandicum DSM 4184]
MEENCDEWDDGSCRRACGEHVRRVMEPILQDLKRRKTAEAIELAKKAGLLPQDFDIEQYRKIAAKYAKPAETGAPEAPQ